MRRTAIITVLMLVSMTFGALGFLAPASADDEPQYPAYPGAPADGCLTVSPTVLETGDTVTITNNCSEPLIGFLNKEALVEGLPTTFTIPCDDSFIRTHTLTTVLPPLLGTVEIQNTLQSDSITGGVETVFASTNGPISFAGTLEAEIFYNFTLQADVGLITMEWNDIPENEPIARVIEDGTYDRYYFEFVPDLLAGATVLIVDADGFVRLPEPGENQPTLTVVDASTMVLEFGPGVEVGPDFNFAIGLEAETLFSASAELLVSGVGPNCAAPVPTPTAAPVPTTVVQPQPTVVVQPQPTAVVVVQPAPVVVVQPAPVVVVQPAPVVASASNYGFGASLPAVHSTATTDKKAVALAHTGSDNTYFVYAGLTMIAAGAVAMGSRRRQLSVEG